MINGENPYPAALLIDVSSSAKEQICTMMAEGHQQKCGYVGDAMGSKILQNGVCAELVETCVLV